MSVNPLSDLKVLDISDGIAGSYCSSLLADYGAEVIKIEPPVTGDPIRSFGPFPSQQPDPETSGLFIHLNANKKGITLNLQSESGAMLFQQLIKVSDIVIESFDPGYLDSIGLGYQVLESINPALVVTSITPFGQSGPYRDYKSTDIGIFAMSGRMYVHGVETGSPLAYGPDVIWYQIGATAAAATMSAIFSSNNYGIGQQLDISCLEAVTGNVDNRLLFFEYTGEPTSRTRWPGGLPQGAYPCADGYVIFGVGYDRYFKRLCHAMEMPWIYSDPRWANYSARTNNSHAFEMLFLEWLLPRTRNEIFRTCQSNRVMCAPLLSFEELIQDDQLSTRGFFSAIHHPAVGHHTTMGPPFMLSNTPTKTKEPSPLLGQHNSVIYGQLGYTELQLSQFRTAGIV